MSLKNSIKIALLVAFIDTSLLLASDVVPNDEAYYIHTNDKKSVEIIYTKENLSFAKETAEIEDALHKNYKKFFDWELDEKLYVGLISSNNQIGNAFATQWPNNRQLNYMGGTELIDYFSSTSWLDTLLYHETAHNYQVNVKGSAISRGLHTVFGNGSVIVALPLTVPNVMENSFMTEGNAVLNESWHGNGGRLYSGRFKAQTILQAKAGHIIPSFVYNQKLAFPYGDIAYIQGGFYNLYLAEKYGLQKVNSYFKYHSEDLFWPQFTNASMKLAVGVEFEKSLLAFANKYSKLSDKFVEVKGENLASSQFFTSLGNSENEVFFITNESGVRAPELVVFNKKTKKTRTKRESWLAGKVIKVDNEYFTQGSQQTSTTKIFQGLFDKNGLIKKGSSSKMIQAYLSNGDALYFDVNTSFSEAQLYVGDKFYSKVNSSVVVDKEDNIYYFTQNAKTRTLYKNKTALYSYKGFYGIVSDVDSNGVVYFIANSELGSTLYSCKNTKVKRVSKGDNIVEARLVNDKEVLIAAISADDYYYVVNKLETISKEPYETKLFFENKKYYNSCKKRKKNNRTHVEPDLKSSYNSFLEMHYSGTDVTLGYGSYSGTYGSLNLKFEDPLSQNSVTLFISKDSSATTLAGLNYSNSKYLLSYALSAYKVLNSELYTENRDEGFSLLASLPLYKSGYSLASLNASYFQDYDTTQREPLSLMLRLSQSESFGASVSENYLNSLNLYGVSERGDSILGAEYSFKHDLAYEFYVGLGAKYSKSNSVNPLDARGVKIENSVYDKTVDPSAISMASLNGTLYVKEAGYSELGLLKVTNFSSYFFTFPISLQRESFYAKYRYYNLKDYFNNKHDISETRAGVTLSTVFLNSFNLPISLEYIYNDAQFIQNNNYFRVLLGGAF